MNREKFTERYTKARRGAIAADFAHLNEIQREAVLTTEGPLLLLAGAGSGKTTVLISRIANLIQYGCGSDTDFVPPEVTEEDLLFLEDYVKAPDPARQERVRRLCAVDPVEPWRIMAITFTNKAAEELKKRLERMLGPESADVWAMTFHSACVRILRRDIERLGYDRGFTIYDTTDSQSLMKRILKELELDEKMFPHRTVLGHISRAKDKMLSAEEFMQEAEKGYDVRRRHIARAYMEYERRMKAADALDFDDLILLTVRLLTLHEDVREHYRRRFRYISIDEYQDTNHLQYRLARALTGEAGNICVVGDDDQSIYKFRGATIENILSFEQQYKNARVIRLEQNYRSTSHILDAANEVIANNQGRKGKTLWTAQGEGEKVSLHVAGDEREEAQFVASTIMTQVAQGAKWSDHAILYRMNAQSNQLEYAFKQQGVPYRMIGGTKFFDRAEIKDMLAYLCVIQNPGDDLRLLRIINNPPRGIGSRTVEAAQEVASVTGRPLYDVISEAERYEDLAKSAGRLHLFWDMMEELRTLANTIPLDDFYDLLLERTGYIKMLEAKISDENLTRIENVRELKSNILSFLKENDGGTLFDFLDEIALYTDLDQYERQADSVVMMTMHSAKGLEFDTVFIVGAEEGIFPGVRSIGEPEEMEEERRLCYVAITRAMRRLFFVSARRRMLFGKTSAPSVSRFVEEISDAHLDRPAQAAPLRSYSFESFAEGDDGSYRRSRLSGYSGDAGTSRGISAPGSRPAARPVPLSNAAPLPELCQGDIIRHKAFGRGLIVGMKKTGGDALLEVAFDEAGTKRLMLKSAAAYIQKEE